MINFFELLRENNLKATPQRGEILRIIHEEGHITIEKIYAMIKGGFPSLSLSTIYKNLLSMQESGIIKELKIPGEKNRYEIKKEPHQHIVCQKCGSITDIETDLHATLKEISLKYAFTIDEATLSATGVCHSCK